MKIKHKTELFIVGESVEDVAVLNLNLDKVDKETLLYLVKAVSMGWFTVRCEYDMDADLDVIQVKGNKEKLMALNEERLKRNKECEQKDKALGFANEKD